MNRPQVLGHIVPSIEGLQTFVVRTFKGTRGKMLGSNMACESSVIGEWAWTLTPLLGA